MKADTIWFWLLILTIRVLLGHYVGKIMAHRLKILVLKLIIYLSMVFLLAFPTDRKTN